MVARLIEAGHDVAVLGRSAEKRAAVAQLGANAVADTAKVTATAEVVRERLEGSGMTARNSHGSQSFFVTESPDRFVRVGRRFFGPEVESAVRIER